MTTDRRPSLLLWLAIAASVVASATLALTRPDFDARTLVPGLAIGLGVVAIMLTIKAREPALLGNARRNGILLAGAIVLGLVAVIVLAVADQM